MKLQKYIYLFVFIVSVGSVSVYANCMEFQGTTLCDNGDRQIELGDAIYTTRDGEMSMASLPEYDRDYTIYGGYVYASCAHNGRRCFWTGRHHYQGDLSGH